MRQIGDKIRIKSLDWYEKNKNTNGEIALRDSIFVKQMKKYCGQEMTIAGLSNGWILKEDEESWLWSEDAFEEEVGYKENDKILPVETTNKESTNNEREYRITEDKKMEDKNYYDKKQDKDKLRYDLIPGKLICGSTMTDAFDGLVSGRITINDLDSIIEKCIFILGGQNNFLRELAKVYTFGCKKYSEKSWQTVPNGLTRYEAGLFRHIDAFKRGEYVNYEDGGLLHIAQIAFNTLAIKWFMLKEE